MRDLAIIIDTETTGVTDPEPIEVAYGFFDGVSMALAPSALAVQRYRPSKPIELGAMAAHGIMDEELEGFGHFYNFDIPDGVGYMIGYNVDFDWRALGEPDLKRIDVLSMCRALWPALDSHTQGAMLYYLNRKHAREWLRGAHTAAGDVVICGEILAHVNKAAGQFTSVAEMWNFSEHARIPKVISFGKHKGTRIDDLPHSYRHWIMREPDMDPYLVKAVRASLYQQ
jgi:exodeoxyribonuclease X